jgi:hypothetical protein
MADYSGDMSYQDFVRAGQVKGVNPDGTRAPLEQETPTVEALLDTLTERIEARKLLAERAKRNEGSWWRGSVLASLRAHDILYRSGRRAFGKHARRFILNRDPASVIAECDADLAFIPWVRLGIYLMEVRPEDYAPFVNLIARYPTKAKVS